MAEPGSTVDGVDVDAVRGLVTSTPGVARLGSGLPGAMTTYLPGRHVPGVRISESAVDIEVAVSWDRPVTEVARELQRRLAAVAGGRRVNVVVADLAMPGDDAPDEASDASGSTPSGSTPVVPVTPVVPTRAVEPAAVHTGETS